MAAEHQVLRFQSVVSATTVASPLGMLSFRMRGHLVAPFLAPFSFDKKGATQLLRQILPAQRQNKACLAAGEGIIRANGTLVKDFSAQRFTFLAWLYQES